MNFDMSNAELMDELQRVKRALEAFEERQQEYVAEARRRGMHWTDEEMGLTNEREPA